MIKKKTCQFSELTVIVKYSQMEQVWAINIRRNVSVWWDIDLSGEEKHISDQMSLFCFISSMCTSSYRTAAQAV